MRAEGYILTYEQELTTDMNGVEPGQPGYIDTYRDKEYPAGSHPDTRRSE